MTGDGAQIGVRVRHAGRKRHADHVGHAQFREPLEIVEDHAIVAADPTPVRFGIHQLDVEQNQVAAADDAQKVFSGGEPGGAHDLVQALQPLQHRLEKRRLHQRFAAREADPAVGQQRRLTVQQRGELVGPIAATGDPIAIGTMQNLRGRRPPLRVVAPGAVKRTALEEDGRAKPGAIVNGQLTNVENDPARLCFHSPPRFGWRGRSPARIVDKPGSHSRARWPELAGRFIRTPRLRTSHFVVL